MKATTPTCEIARGHGAAWGARGGFSHVGPSASRLAVLQRLRGSLPTQAESFRLHSGGQGDYNTVSQVLASGVGQSQMGDLGLNITWEPSRRQSEWLGTGVR